MDSVKSAMNEIVFDEPDSFSPIPYTMMYVQWEANKVYNSIPYIEEQSKNNFTEIQGLVKGAKLCLNPYFFGWLEKEIGWL